MNSKLFHLLLLYLLLQSHSDVVAQATTESQHSHLKSPMTIVVALLVLVLCILVCLFSIFNRRWAAEAHSGSPYRPQQLHHHHHQGLEAAVIETFPILNYAAVKHLKNGKGELECAVCLCEFKDYETLRLLLNCFHVFHPQCVDPWLASHLTCPVCRTNLAPEFNKPGPENGALLSLDEIVIKSQSASLGLSPTQLGQSTESYRLRLPEELGSRWVLTNMLPPVLAEARSGGGGGGEISTPHGSVSQLPV